MSISNFASKFDDDIFDVVIPGESVYFDYKCNLENIYCYCIDYLLHNYKYYFLDAEKTFSDSMFLVNLKEYLSVESKKYDIIGKYRFLFNQILGSELDYLSDRLRYLVNRSFSNVIETICYHNNLWFIRNDFKEEECNFNFIKLFFEIIKCKSKIKQIETESNYLDRLDIWALEALVEIFKNDFKKTSINFFNIYKN